MKDRDRQHPLFLFLSPRSSFLPRSRAHTGTGTSPLSLGAAANTLNPGERRPDGSITADHIDPIDPPIELRSPTQPNPAVVTVTLHLNSSSVCPCRSLFLVSSLTPSPSLAFDHILFVVAHNLPRTRTSVNSATARDSANDRRTRTRTVRYQLQTPAPLLLPSLLPGFSSRFTPRSHSTAARKITQPVSRKSSPSLKLSLNRISTAAAERPPHPSIHPCVARNEEHFRSTVV